MCPIPLIKSYTPMYKVKHNSESIENIITKIKETIIRLLNLFLFRISKYAVKLKIKIIIYSISILKKVRPSPSIYASGIKFNFILLRNLSELCIEH